jgi:hypothetical protein
MLYFFSIKDFQNREKTMKKVFLFCIVLFLILSGCDDTANQADDDDDNDTSTEYIIADHTVVDRYDDIPQEWINEVKKMLVDIAGESHSAAYRTGIDDLEGLNSLYQAETFDGSIPAATEDYLRLGRHDQVGEADFYTSQPAIDDMKQVIADAENSGNPIHVLGFGWCWDMTWRNAPTTTRDPVFDVGWAGSSAGGPEGGQYGLQWGLDSDDYAITGNSICMDTYLDAVEQYTDFCKDNNYECVPIFTTGPVDGNNGTENGFQREIKHDYIRDYVIANGGILFDYADILCYNDAGELAEYTWDDSGTSRVHKGIHSDNEGGTGTGHIGSVGALRLAKAMWWLLARIAGWDGN